MIKELITNITNLIQSNQAVSAMVGLYGMGVLTYLFRNIPSTIIGFLKRHFTTSITITSQNKIFHNSTTWFSEIFKNKNYRTIKLSNGKYGYKDETTKSIGYGHHWLFWERRLFLVKLIKDTENKTEYDKDTIIVTTLGRSHKKLNKLIQEIKNINKNTKDKIDIYKMNGEGWEFVREQNKRSFDTIFLEKEKKDELLNRVDKFVVMENWYLENGIPYQLGILLYGAPGTGKTSIIKALASYLNYPLYYVDPLNISSLNKHIGNIPNKCLVVIEDIDSNTVTHNREKHKKKEKVKLEDDLQEMLGASLSSVLNSLDGFFSPHGRILITTTNHIEKLDPAILRPGRIDSKIEIGYVTMEVFLNYLNRFFYGKFNETLIGENELKSNLTMSELQNLVLEDRDILYVLDYCLLKGGC